MLRHFISFNPILVKLQLDPPKPRVDALELFQWKGRDMAEWIKSRIQEVEDSLSSISIPHGEASGLCKYCRHQTRCYNDGNGLIERPLSIPKMKPSSHNMLTNPCSTRKTYS